MACYLWFNNQIYQYHMKNYSIRPGFEFIFALSLIVIMALPLLVFAQGKKGLEIKIINGDTTINGKNIKELSPQQRLQVLKDIDDLGNVFGPEGKEQHFVFRKKGLPDTGAEKIIIEKRRQGDSAWADMPGFGNDTGGRYKFKMRRPGGWDSVLTNNYRMNGGPDERYYEFHMPGPRMEFHHRNVQSFDFTNTGNDGISTHVSYRVTEPSPAKLKAVTGSDKADLDLKDLALTPEFSSGKTILMFSLAARSAAEVRLTDNEGKLIWSDKALNGSLHKSFVLGLNGTYFLEVKQAGKIALKRIIKEE
jgi:hypothetical protein